MGLNEGVVEPGEIINDAPMHIAGHTGQGVLSTIMDRSMMSKHLEVSSNVYMFNIAIRLAGADICAVSVTWASRIRLRLLL